MYSLLTQFMSIVSTLLLGVMAGFFATYSFNINYAMLALNGEMYATVQSLFNVSVRHPGFFICFFGAGVASIATAILLLIKRRSVGWAWLAIGLVYLCGIVMFTRMINLPLNYYIESWDVLNLPSDWRSIRGQWNNANLFRSGVSGMLFAAATFLLSRTKTRDF